MGKEANRNLDPKKIQRSLELAVKAGYVFARGMCEDDVREGLLVVDEVGGYDPNKKSGENGVIFEAPKEGNK